MFKIFKRREGCVTIEMVESWSWLRRLCNNAIAMFGPVL